MSFPPTVLDVPGSSLAGRSVLLACLAFGFAVGLPAQPLFFEAEAQHASYRPAHNDVPQAPMVLTTSGPSCRVATDRDASNGWRLAYDGATDGPLAVGDWIEFTLEGVPAGTYSLAVVSRGATSHGMYRATLDGAAIGPTVDQYTPAGGAALLVSTSLAEVTFTSRGHHLLRFTIVDRHPNSSGYELSFDQFVLDPWVAPAITAHPVGQTVMAGESVEFTVASTGTPKPVYQWHKDGNEIVGATDATYHLASVRGDDAGDYTVAVSNPEGSTISAPATLRVNPAPVFDTRRRERRHTDPVSPTDTRAGADHARRAAAKPQQRRRGAFRARIPGGMLPPQK